MKPLEKIKKLRIEDQKPLTDLKDRINSLEKDLEALEAEESQIAINLDSVSTKRDQLAVQAELDQSDPEDLSTLDKELDKLKAELDAITQKIRIKQLAVQRLKSDYESEKKKVLKGVSKKVEKMHTELIDKQTKAFSDFLKTSEELAEFEKKIPQGVPFGWMGLTRGELKSRFEPKLPWWMDRAVGRGYDL